MEVFLSVVASSSGVRKLERWDDASEDWEGTVGLSAGVDVKLDGGGCEVRILLLGPLFFEENTEASRRIVVVVDAELQEEQ